MQQPAFCRRRRAALAAGISALAIAAPLPAFAADSTIQEVVVTARKREESLMRTPVVMQAVTATQIQDLHITDIYSIHAATPGLIISPAIGSVGATVNLRGLGNGAAANYVDQSVGLNIDGVGVSNGSFFRGALFDVSQIEVLKGPQALIFGKSTSAGVVAIHTADPSNTFESKVTAAYGFKGDEVDLNGFVSGPITDTFGVRLSAYRNTTGGWWINPNPANSSSRYPDDESWGGRLTLKYQSPGGDLRVRLKTSFDRIKSNMSTENANHQMCSNGVSSIAIFNEFPQICNSTIYSPPDANAKPYRPGVYPPFDPTPFQTGWPSPLYRDGVAYADTDTSLNVLTVDYNITPDLTLTSVSGYSWVEVHEAQGTAQAALGFFGLAVRDQLQEYSQEIRLTSDWKDSWINFMVGGLYNPSQRKDDLDLTLPGLGIQSEDIAILDTTNQSLFGQLILTPVDKFELAVGLRYTEVEKEFKSAISLNNYSQAFPPFFTNNSGLQQIQNIPEANRKFSENATTPEVTLTYRPTEDLTAFISYKKGYKGPGFNFSLTDIFFTEASASPFGGERAEGVEGGVKANLLNRHLALTATGYLYDYKGLQVAIPSTTTVVIRPDADARVQGIELGATYNPPIDGLTLSAFINYNDAHYTHWTDAPCWGGQLPSQGCVTNPLTGATSQDLTDSPLTSAPKWAGNFAIDYKRDVAERYLFSMNFGGEFSGSYNVVAEKNPNGRQGAYVSLNTAIHFGRSDGAWDVALLGRNLNDEHYFLQGQDRGVAGLPMGIPADASVQVARPREILLQVTLRPELL